MAAEHMVVADCVMDAAEGVSASKTGYDTGNNEENLNGCSSWTELLERPLCRSHSCRTLAWWSMFAVSDGVEIGEEMQIKVSTESHSEVMEALESGEALDTMAAGGLDVQNSDLDGFEQVLLE